MVYIIGDGHERDIDKAIHYLSLAANKNYDLAQFNLGIIYKDGKYIKRDIKKAIYYLKLAARQNNSIAQYNLACIYFENIDIQQDMSKAIYYLLLAADQNLPEAQCDIGLCYYRGIYIEKDVNKAIYYLTLAADKNLLRAQYILGLIYLDEEYDKRDIDKSIYYLKLAAIQKLPDAQVCLGKIYYELDVAEEEEEVNYIHYLTLASYQDHPEATYILGLIKLSTTTEYFDPYKGIDLLIRSSNCGNHDADFLLGYCYYEGIYVSQDAKKMMHYYRNASSFNNPKAKNNLGHIYKNGFGTEIPKNIGFAKIYFHEAISRYGNIASMYNLAHIYIYEDKTKQSIEQSIDLLINASKMIFFYSEDLLSIALILKHGNDINKIKQDLYARTNKSSRLFTNICKRINENKLFYESFFNKKYQYLKSVDFLYSYWEIPITQENVNELRLNPKKIESAKNVTSDFYKGFGCS